MNPLRVGLIGAGGISRVHADGWRELGADVTVFSHEGAEALAAEYGFAVAPDLGSLLAACDIVDIVTSTTSHGPLAHAAIGAGKHVICEKPLAGTAAEARGIVDAARRAGVRLFPAHVVRYFPDYVAMREQLISGRIGELAVLRFLRGGEAPRTGSWFHVESEGGGIIRDQMIHDLDQALWLAGDVERVYAVRSAPASDDVAPDAVTAHVVLTHASGAVSHVQGTWGPPGLPFRTSADLAGSLGTLSIDSAERTPSRMELPGAAGGGGYLPPQANAVSPYTSELRAFVAAIESDEAAAVTPADGVRAVQIAEAAAVSLTTGQPVALALDPIDAEDGR